MTVMGPGRLRRPGGWSPRWVAGRTGTRGESFESASGDGGLAPAREMDRTGARPTGAGVKVPSMSARSLSVAGLVAGALLVGCGGSSGPDPSTGVGPSGATIRVPDDHASIQAAVDAAASGDLILVAPGVYPESVSVTTPNVVIRGLDRNRVILDGENTRSDGIEVSAGGVAVENLTIRRYLNNGLLFDGTAGGTADGPLVGWRGSYITAHNNGLYGVYAFASRAGRFDHVYASGHADSGIYVGQCKPCEALVTDSVAEANSIGYEGTNSSGVVLARSTYRRNRVGITSNTQDRERLAPSEDVTIVGNLVVDNDEPRSPESEGAFGFGIAVGGSVRTTVTRNRVADNAGVGIVVTTLEGHNPSANRVVGNTLARNGTDLAYFRSDAPTAPQRGNCFARNRFTTSYPPRIEAALPCTSDRGRVSGAPKLVRQPPGISFRDVPSPPPQPNMPGVETAPAEPALGLPGPIDIAAIALPDPA